jgi:nucleotide-binding universal stress UspA family protein
LNVSYKSILVHVDEKPRSEARITYSLALATRFEAHVTALALVQPPRYPQPTLPLLGPEIAVQQMKYAHERADQAVAQFSELARRAGVTSVETRTVRGDLPNVIALQARYSDLVVIGQHDPDDPSDDTPDARNYPELITMSVGRPVLVVPYAGKFPSVGQNVAVAWDAGREATRAVTDSLPILKKAAKVTVLAINPNKVGGHGAEPGADIALYLARHGVKVEASQQHSGGLDVGSFLLSRLADMDADLLVMGAYGHSRLREMVLGGVTRTILDSMTVPVLMSH